MILWKCTECDCIAQSTCCDNDDIILIIDNDRSNLDILFDTTSSISQTNDLYWSNLQINIRVPNPTPGLVIKNLLHHITSTNHLRAKLCSYHIWIPSGMDSYICIHNHTHIRHCKFCEHQAYLNSNNCLDHLSRY